MTALTQAQRDAIQGALDELQTKIATKGAGGIVYDAIYDAITVNDAPAEGIPHNVWVWIAGARNVNSGTGAFAQLIRDTTAIQWKIRYGTDMPESVLDMASNNIAFNVGLDFLDTTKPFPPTIGRIGASDAGAIAGGVFGSDIHPGEAEGNWSAWAGTTLFVNLGYSEFFRDYLLNGSTDGKETTKSQIGTYDLIAANQSIQDFQTALGSAWQNFYNNVRTAWDLNATYGSNVDAAVVEGDAWLTTQYGLDSRHAITAGSDLLGYVSTATNLLKSANWHAGSYGDDTLTNVLSGGMDVLNAGKGNDTIRGGSGSDIVDGGEGLDSLSYASGSLSYRYTMTLNVNRTWADASPYRMEIEKIPSGSGQSAWDFAFNVESLVLGQYADTAKYDGVNTLFAVTIDGGNGMAIDTLDLSGMSRVLTASDFDGTTVKLGSASFIGFEKIIGTNGDDVISLSTTIQSAVGGGGNDIFRNAWLMTQIEGGEGIDTVSYEGATAAVTASLSNASISSIENLVGSSYGDVLTGNAGDNVIDGGAGNDLVYRTNGSDVYRGGRGSDILVFDGSLSEFNITSIGILDSQSILTFSRQNQPDFQRAINIEKLSFADGVRSYLETALDSSHIGSSYYSSVNIRTVEEGDISGKIVFQAVLKSTFPGYSISSEGEGIIGVHIGSIGYNNLFEATYDNFTKTVSVIAKSGTIYDAETTIMDGMWLQYDIFKDGFHTFASSDLQFGIEDVYDNGLTAINSMPLRDASRAAVGSILFGLAPDQVDLNDLVEIKLVDDADGRFRLDENNNVVLTRWDFGNQQVVQITVEASDGVQTISKQIDIPLYREAPTGIAFSINGPVTNETQPGTVVGHISGVFDADQVGGHQLTLFDPMGLLQLNGNDIVLSRSVTQNETLSPLSVVLRATDDDALFVDVPVTVQVEWKDSSVIELTGTSGSDTLVGVAGADRLLGFDGDDFLFGSDGADTLDGGNGNDWAVYSFGSPAGVIVNLDAGMGFGGYAAGDQIFSIENVMGTGLSDVLIGSTIDNILVGNAGNDMLMGGNGADSLSGGSGDDQIDGEAGDDLVIGDRGNDQLFGGMGEDVFVFNQLDWSPQGGTVAFGWGHDVVNDFEVGIDKIDIRDLGLTYQDLVFMQVGSDVMLFQGMSQDTILFKNQTAAAFSASDFFL